jgi:hypothetical protein
MSSSRKPSRIFRDAAEIDSRGSAARRPAPGVTAERRLATLIAALFGMHYFARVRLSFSSDIDRMIGL